jgi:nucleotide-binding universal stress UspA family protein
MRDDVHGWVVVGVDGSEHSRRALEWARQEAALRHVGCVVLHAWHYGGLDANPYFGMAVPEAEAAAHDLLEQELAIGGRREIPLVGRVVESDPADALIEPLMERHSWWSALEAEGGLPLRSLAR